MAFGVLRVTLTFRGFASKTIVKLFNILEHAPVHRSLLSFHMENYLDEFNLKDISRQRILLEGSERLLSWFHKFFMMLNIATICYGLFPFYQYVTGERPLLLKVVFPVLPTVGVGYYINITYQIMTSFFCYAGILSNDMLFLYLLLMYTTSIDLMEQNCVELTDIIRRKIDSPIERKKYLRNILIQIQDLDK